MTLALAMNSFFRWVDQIESGLMNDDLGGIYDWGWGWEVKQLRDSEDLRHRVKLNDNHAKNKIIRDMNIRMKEAEDKYRRTATHTWRKGSHFCKIYCISNRIHNEIMALIKHANGEFQKSLKYDQLTGESKIVIKTRGEIMECDVIISEAIRVSYYNSEILEVLVLDKMAELVDKYPGWVFWVETEKRHDFDGYHLWET